MKKLLLTGTLIGTVALFSSASALAETDIDHLQTLVQGEFKGLTEDLGAALSYKSLAPASTLGVTGFDLSLSVTGTSLDSLAAWEKATNDNDIPSTLPVPMLRVTKGLPFNIDVGAFYLQIPDSNIRLYGGEARWAFIEGGVATPAVALHGTYSKVTGVDQLDLDTKSVDISISKGFTIVTPYAGIGQVWTNAKPVGVQQLHSESITQTKYFGGLNLNFGLPNIAAEVDQTGGITSYGLKFGLRW
ncbi:MAG: hypothetical protein QM808_11520 [Steroidobacteraceae bacterium]